MKFIKVLKLHEIFTRQLADEGDFLTIRVRITPKENHFPKLESWTEFAGSVHFTVDEMLDSDFEVQIS
jgi:hypothetical protein